MTFLLPLVSFIPSLLSYKQKKQELNLRWWELIFSVLKDLSTFVVRHIRVILISLILALGAWHYLSLRAHDARITAEYAEFKANIAAEQERQRLKVEFDTHQAILRTKIMVDAHKKEVANILAKNGRLKNDKALTDSILNSARDGLRLAVQREANLRMPENGEAQPASADGNATIARQDEYINTLEHAGAVCASDYNACLAHIKINEDLIGVAE